MAAQTAATDAWARFAENAEARMAAAEKKYDELLGDVEELHREVSELRGRVADADRELSQRAWQKSARLFIQQLLGAMREHDITPPPVPSDLEL